MEKTATSLPQKIWKLIKENPIVVLLVIVCVLVGFTIDNFFSIRNFNSLISNTTVRSNTPHTVSSICSSAFVSR